MKSMSINIVLLLSLSGPPQVIFALRLNTDAHNVLLRELGELDLPVGVTI